jgi:hypothetical protein
MMSRSILDRLSSKAAYRVERVTSGLAALTSESAGQGLSSSPRDAGHPQQHLLAKLGVNSRAQTIATAPAGPARIFCRTTYLTQLRGGAQPHQVIPRFTGGRSAMKLVFAALILSSSRSRCSCSERSSRVSITDIERHQIDPPPTMEEREGRSTRLK